MDRRREAERGTWAGAAGCCRATTAHALCATRCSRRARGAKLPTEVHLDPNIRDAMAELQRHLGTKVLLRQKTKLRPGQLVLEFYDDAQLMGIYDRLMK